MAANTSRIEILAGRIGFGTLTAANTSKVGGGTTLNLFTAGTNGSRLDRIAIRSKGANVASLARIFVSNGTDMSLIDEIALPATTVSEVAAKPAEDYVRAIHLPTGYSVHVTLATAVSDGWQFTGFGGDY